MMGKRLSVNDVDQEVVEKLTLRAQNQGRSLEGELKVILARAAAISIEDTRLDFPTFGGRA